MFTQVYPAWPNDVLLNGRKTAGVLIESEIEGAEVKCALVGVGLNVNFDIDPTSEIANIATSVKQELGREAIIHGRGEAEPQGIGLTGRRFCRRL